MEDFSRPKIVYSETTQGAYFAYDNKGLYIDKTCFMLMADDAEYLQHTLTSRLFEFAYKRIFASVELGEHGYQYNKHALVKLPVIKPPNKRSFLNYMEYLLDLLFSQFCPNIGLNEPLQQDNLQF